MKTNIQNAKWRWLAVVAALAVAGAGNIPTQTTAQAPSPPTSEKGTAKGGAQQLMRPIQSAKDAESVQPGDVVAMACPKCRTVVTKTVTAQTARGANTPPGTAAKHLCPSCETTIRTKAAGKQVQNEIVHVCKTCGSEDAFCCVMKKGSGPTPGMDRPK